MSFAQIARHRFGDESRAQASQWGVRRGVLVLATILACYLTVTCSNVARAQTWVGGVDGNWGTGGNWSPAGVPVQGNALTLTFGAVTGTTILNQNVGSPFVLNQLSFVRTNTAAQYTLTGGDLLFDGANAQIQFSGAAVSGTGGLYTQTIANNIIIGGTGLSLIATGTNGNVLRLTGATITATGPGVTLTLGGSSTNASTLSNSIQGDITIQKTGAGLWLLNGVNTFTGSVNVQAGTLRITNSQGLGAGTSITLGSVGLTGVLSFSTAAANPVSFARSITIVGGTSAFGSGIITNDGALTSTVAIGGTITGDGNSRILQLGGATANAANVVSSLISDGTGTLGLMKTGVSTWYLSNSANSFTGGVTIIAGALRLDMTNGLLQGINGNNIRYFAAPGTGGVIETRGTFTADLGTAANQLQWTGTGGGGFAAQGGALTVRLNAGLSDTTLIWNTTTGFTRTGGELQFGSTTADSLLEFQNPINLSNAPRTIRITDNTTSSGDVVWLSGGITSPAGSGLSLVGSGTAILSTSNTYLGGTTINGVNIIIRDDLAFTSATITLQGTSTFNTDTVAITLSNALTLSGNLVISGSNLVTLQGALVTTGTAGRTVSVNNVQGAVMNGLITPNANLATGFVNTITFTTAPTSTLVLNSTISEASRTAGVVYSGGNVYVNAANSYTAGTTISGGRIFVNDWNTAFGSGTLSLNGGILVPTTASTITNIVNFGGNVTLLAPSADLTIDGPGLSRITAATTLSLAANSLTFNDEVQLNGSLTFTTGAGAVRLNNGLSLTGAAAANLFVNSPNGLTINNGINLSADAVVHALTLRSGANGTLTVNGPITDGSTPGGSVAVTTGTVILNGNNSYSGGTTLATAVLGIGSNTALGSGRLIITQSTAVLRAEGAYTLANDTVLLHNFTLNTPFSLTLGGGITVSAANRSITLAGSSPAYFTGLLSLGEANSGRVLTLIGTTSTELRLMGTIADGTGGTGGALALNGGNYTIGGANTFSGFTSILSGTIAIASNSAFGTSSVQWTAGTIRNDDAARVISNTINLLGSVAFANTQPLTLTGTVFTTTGRTITLNGAAPVVLNNLVMNTALSGSFVTTFNGAGPLTVTGVISQTGPTNAGVVLTNTGGATFLANNTYGGNTTINAGVTLTLGNGLGSSGNLSGTLNVVAGGRAVLSYGSGTTTYGLTSSANIVGAGSVEINGASDARVVFDKANGYTGFTTVSQGTLRLGNAGALAPTSSLIVNSTGTVELNGLNLTVASLSDGGSGGGQIVNDVNTSLLTVTQGYFSGNITGTGLSLLKNGTAVLQLNGLNQFTSPSTVANGTLIVGNNLALGTADVRFSGVNTLTLQAGASSVTLANNITMTTLNLNIAGSNNLTISQLMTVAQGTVRTLTFSSTGTTTLAGITSMSGSPVRLDMNLVFGTGANVIIGGLLRQSSTFGVFNLTGGSAMVRVTGSNDLTHLRIGGDLQVAFLGGDNSLTTVTTNLTMSNTALLALSGNHSFTSVDSIFVTNRITNSSNSAIVITTSAGSFAGLIDNGSGTIAINKISSGALTLANDNLFTGPLTIAAGTVNIGTGGATGSLSAQSITNSGALVWNRTGSMTYAGDISGTGAMTMTGGGTFVFSGASVTYTGATTIGNNTSVTFNAGTQRPTANGAISVLNSAVLNLNGAVMGSGAVTLANGSRLSGFGSLGAVTANLGSEIFVGHEGSAGTLTLGSLTLAGGSLNFDLGTSSDLLRVMSLTPTISAASILNLNAITGFTGGNFTLISGYAGTISTTGLGNLTINAPSGYSYNLTNVAGSLSIDFLAAAQKLWAGSLAPGGDIWDVGTTANFTLTGLPAVFNDGDAVTFDDTAIVPDITISNNGAAVVPTSVLVVNTAQTFTFRGDGIGGGNGIDKQGSGILVLANNNTFTGAVQVSGGTLQIGNGGLNGVITSTLGIQLDNNSVFAINRSGTIDLSGNITGSGNLVKTGSGTLNLSGTNTYFGNTTILGGTLRVLAVTALQNAPGSLVSVSSGTLDISTGSGTVTLTNVVVGSDGVLATNSTGTLTLVTVTNNGRLSANAGNIVATTITNNGTMVVNSGVSQVANLSSFGSLNVAAGTLNVGTLNLLNGIVNFTGGNMNVTTAINMGNAVADSAPIINIGPGQVLSVTGSINYAGTSTNSVGAVIQGAGQLSLGGNRTFNILDGGAADDLTIVSNITHTASAFTKTGAGTLYLLGDNAATGFNTVSQGTLAIGGTNVLGSNTLQAVGGALRGDGTARTINNLVHQRGAFAVTGTSALTFSNITAVNGGQILTVNNAGLTTLSTWGQLSSTSAALTPQITGSGNVDIYQLAGQLTQTASNFNVNGTGTYRLLGAHSATTVGTFFVRNGNVIVSHSGAINGVVNVATVTNSPAAAPVFLLGSLDGTSGMSLANSITVASSSAGTNLTIGGLSAETSTFSGDITLSNANTFVTAPTSGTVQFNGIVSGNGGITKIGNGSLLINGTNTFTGVSTIQAGLVRAGNANALGNGGRWAVNQGATLDLNGFATTFTALVNGTNGGGLVTSGAAGPVEVAVQSGTFGGVIANGTDSTAILSLNKTTAGVLILSNDNTYTGITTVSGGTLQLGTGGSAGSVSSTLIQNFGILSFSRGGAYTYGGAVSGTGSVQINGGQITLGGVSNYTGTTLIQSGASLNVAGSLGNTAVTVTNGGSLLGAGTIGGPVSLRQTATLAGTLTVNGIVTSTGSLAPGGVGTVGQLTLGGLILNGGSLGFDLGAIGLTTSDQLILTTTVAPTISATTALNVNNLAGFGAGTYNLITGYTGTISSGFGNLVPNSLLGYTLTLQNNSGSLDLLVSLLSNQNLVWTGSANNVWDMTSANWVGTGPTFVNGASEVTFDASSTVNNITVTGSGVSVVSMTVDGSASYTFSGGTISGATVTSSLYKSGAGTLALANSVSFTGGAVVNGGTLQIGAGGGSGSFAGDIVNNSLVAFDRLGTLTYSGAITGTGAVTVTGGTVIFTGNNNYSGGTSVLGGTLQIGNGTGAGQIAGNIFNAGTLVINRTGSTPYSGVISGNGGVSILTGTIILLADQTFTGATTISSGAVLNLGAGGGAGKVAGDITNSGTLNFNLTGVTSVGQNIIGSGGVGILSGTVVYTSAQAYSGVTTIASGAQLALSGTAGNIVGDVSNAGLLTLNHSLTYGGVISGSGSVRVQGAQVSFSADQQYDGTTLIASGAVLSAGIGGTTGQLVGDVTNDGILNFNINAASAFGRVISGVGDVAVLSGTMTFTSTQLYSGVTTIASGANLVLGGSAGSVAGNIANAGGLTFAHTLTYGGSISGDGSVQVDGGTVQLNGANTYIGPTSVNGGSLLVNGSLAAGSTVSVANGATLGGLGTVGGTVNVAGGGLLTGTLTVNSAVTVAGTVTPGTVGTVATMTLANLVLSGATLNFDLGAPTIGSYDRLWITGTGPTVTTTAAFNFNSLGISTGTYHLLSGYTGSIANVGGISFNSFGGFSMSLLNNNGSLDLLVAVSGSSLSWTGGNGAWDFGTANFSGGATFTNGDHVSFLSVPGGANSVVTVTNTGVLPGSMLVNNDSITPYSFTGGSIGGAGSLVKQGLGSLTFSNVNNWSGGTSVLGGTMIVGSGGSISNTNNVYVSNATLTVAAGGQILGGGQVIVSNSGNFIANGYVTGTVNVQSGGTMQGTGQAGNVVVFSGGHLSPGNSVGTLVLDGNPLPGSQGSLTLYGGADLIFEFNHATTTTGGVPGTDWDYIDLTGGGMLHIINANNQNPANQITVHVDSWKLDNSGHGGGVGDGANFNGFNDAAATGWGVNQRQSYFWKFIGLDNASNITVTDAYLGSIAGRFRVIDDALNAGVFGSGNPFTRPENQFGKGTFKIVDGDFGQGYGLYVYYAAIPEPSSIILAGLGSLGAGWYGRRRLRKKAAEAAAESSPIDVAPQPNPLETPSSHDAV